MTVWGCAKPPTRGLRAPAMAGPAVSGRYRGQDGMHTCRFFHRRDSRGLLPGKTTVSDVESDFDELGTSLAAGSVIAHRAALGGTRVDPRLAPAVARRTPPGVTFWTRFARPALITAQPKRIAPGRAAQADQPGRFGTRP
jgi:hypothetical protein